MTLALVENNKALQQALYLNLVTTGGFEVSVLTFPLKDIPSKQYAALLINQHLIERVKPIVPQNILTIVYQPLVSKINEPCSVIAESPSSYSLRFSMAALPGFSEAVKQILMKN